MKVESRQKLRGGVDALPGIIAAIEQMQNQVRSQRSTVLSAPIFDGLWGTEDRLESFYAETQNNSLSKCFDDLWKTTASAISPFFSRTAYGNVMLNSRIASRAVPTLNELEESRYDIESMDYKTVPKTVSEFAERCNQFANSSAAVIDQLTELYEQLEGEYPSRAEQIMNGVKAFGAAIPGSRRAASQGPGSGAFSKDGPPIAPPTEKKRGTVPGGR